MFTPTFQTYDEAAKEYLAQFSQLVAAPRAAATRSATSEPGPIAADVLLARATDIAGISRSMVTLSRPLFESPDLETREGISAQFLAQAAAELQLATELFKLAGSADGLSTRSLESGAAEAPVDYAALSAALGDLQSTMQATDPPRLAATVPQTRALAGSPATIDEAKQLLVRGVEQNTSAIVQRVRDLSGMIAVDLLLHTEWSAVLEGVKLLGKDVAQELDSLAQGFGTMLAKGASIAVQTLLNAYDKVLALIGQDPNSPARRQIQDWLEQLRQHQAVSLLNQLIDRFYQVPEFKQQLNGWLAKTSAALDPIYQTSLTVSQIAAKFAALGDKINAVEKVVTFAKMVKVPEVLVAVTAIQIALLTFVVYAGYDYIGYQDPNFHVTFPDLTKGIAKVVQENLGVEK